MTWKDSYTTDEGFWLRAPDPKQEGAWVHWTGSQWHRHPAYGLKYETEAIAREVALVAGKLFLRETIIQIARAKDGEAVSEVIVEHKR